jgi:phage N-6-adenine-methyltransferase
MRLMGYKPGHGGNHPLGVKQRGGIPDDQIDSRHTPAKIWEPLNQEFGFTLDVAASSVNAKCALFFDLRRNGLRRSWAGHRVWCNPPFSGLALWVQKAHVEVRRGCPLAVLLLPANRTDQRWWQTLIEPIRDRSMGLATRFLPGRARFATDSQPETIWKSTAPFGLVVAIFTPPGGRS